MTSIAHTTEPDPRAAIARNIAAEIARAGHSKGVAKYVAGVLDCHPSSARRKLDGLIPFTTEEAWALAIALGVNVVSFFPDELAPSAVA